MTEPNVNYAALVGALMHFANTERDMATTEIDGPLWQGTRKANHAAEGQLRRMFLALTAERDRYRTALELIEQTETDMMAMERLIPGARVRDRVSRQIAAKALRPAPDESEAVCCCDHDNWSAECPAHPVPGREVQP